MTIGEKIKKLRKDNNITQTQIAKELNLTDATICYYENNKREPDIQTIKKLASYFNTTTDELLGYEEKLTQGTIKKYITPEQDDWINLLNELTKNYGKEFTNNIVESLWKLAQSKNTGES